LPTCGARQTGYQPISKRIGFCETPSRGIETLFQSPVRRTPPAVVAHNDNTYLYYEAKFNNEKVN